MLSKVLASLVEFYKGEKLSLAEYLAIYLLLLSPHHGKRIAGRRTKLGPNPPLSYCDFDWESLVGWSPAELSLWKKCSNSTSSPLSVYQNYMIKGIKVEVNDLLLCLLPDSTPRLHLLFDVATVEQVLKWQSEGHRCVTTFIKPTELVSTFADSYPPYQKHDCFSFALHDLHHYSKFIIPSLFLEQVGFFRWLSRAWPFLVGSFAKDDQWLKDLEHAAADMNSVSTHLLSFIKAKWMLAYARNLLPPTLEKPGWLDDLHRQTFEKQFMQPAIALLWNEPDAWLDEEADCDGLEVVLQSVDRICTEEWQKLNDDISVIRRMFWWLGRQVLINNETISLEFVP